MYVLVSLATTSSTISTTVHANPVNARYVQDWTLMRFKFLMISIRKCPHWLKVTKTHTIQSNMNMKISNNPAKYKVLIKQYLRYLHSSSLYLAIHVHFQQKQNYSGWNEVSLKYSIQISNHLLHLLNNRNSCQVCSNTYLLFLPFVCFRLMFDNCFTFY